MTNFQKYTYKSKYNTSHRTMGYYTYLVDLDLKEKKTPPPVKYNKIVWDAGVNWFNQVFSLEEASEELQKDVNFIRGYDHARRLQKINNEFEALGMEWYYAGRTLVEAFRTYANHPSFIKGYNDAKAKTMSKGL